MRLTHPRWWDRTAGFTKFVFWAALLYVLVQQACGPMERNAERADILARLQEERNSRVIALIHRQETVALLGIPIRRYIDIEDSEAILRAIRLTPPDKPIDLIVHTPGGLVLAAEQIAKALADHPGKVTVFVPHYAMSGGTLLALASDDIVMDPNAVLGPVDPQIGDLPAASLIKLRESKSLDHISDEMFILSDIAQKSRRQVNEFVDELLRRHMPDQKAAELARTLTEGKWTHDFPITVDTARKFGLNISTEMPAAIYKLMDLYPQGGQGRPSVLYVPLRRTSRSSPDSGGVRRGTSRRTVQ